MSEFASAATADLHQRTPCTDYLLRWYLYRHHGTPRRSTGSTGRRSALAGMIAHWSNPVPGKRLNRQGASAVSSASAAFPPGLLETAGHTYQRWHQKVGRMRSPQDDPPGSLRCVNL